jgi:hypothetical protein
VYVLVHYLYCVVYYYYCRTGLLLLTKLLYCSIAGFELFLEIMQLSQRDFIASFLFSSLIAVYLSFKIRTISAMHKLN